VIPGFPNGATRLSATAVTPKGERTQGTETSKYLLEEKSIEMPGVVASETGRAQTVVPWGCGVVGPTYALGDVSRSPLERGAADGDSPVGENHEPDVVEFLSNARLEKSGVKLGGPPSKAKYSRVTDSERVP
jgi:hypothetical protein